MSLIYASSELKQNGDCLSLYIWNWRMKGTTSFLLYPLCSSGTGQWVFDGHWQEFLIMFIKCSQTCPSVERAKCHPGNGTPEDFVCPFRWYLLPRFSGFCKFDVLKFTRIQWFSSFKIRIRTCLCCGSASPSGSLQKYKTRNSSQH